MVVKRVQKRDRLETMAERWSHDRIFFYLLLVGVVGVAFLMVRPFISLTILAFLGATAFQPAYRWWHTVFRHHVGLATAFSVLTFFFVLFIPVYLFINLTFGQIVTFSGEMVKIVELSHARSGFDADEVGISFAVRKANEWLALLPGGTYQLSYAEVRDLVVALVRPLGGWLLSAAIAVGRGAPFFVTKIIIFFILLSSFFPIQPKFLMLVKRLSPLDDTTDMVYLNRVMAMMEAMLKGTFVVALVQGLGAGLLLWIAGVPYSAFWTMLAIFAGIIPLGAAAVSIPIGIVWLLLGQTWQGLLVLLGSILVVANLDNLLRPRLVPKEASLHPALTLLGVFGGLTLFGFWGVMYGPAVMILLTTTLEVYLKRKTLIE